MYSNLFNERSDGTTVLAAFSADLNNQYTGIHEYIKQMDGLMNYFLAHLVTAKALRDMAYNDIPKKLG